MQNDSGSECLIDDFPNSARRSQSILVENKKILPSIPERGLGAGAANDPDNHNGKSLGKIHYKNV